jgi:hypothetical protein
MKQTAVDYLHERYMYVTWQRNIGLISEKQEDKYRVYYLAEAKEMEKEQQKQMLIGLLDWMNKVAQDNPMVFETDSEDIVDMYLQAYYTK